MLPVLPTLATPISARLPLSTACEALTWWKQRRVHHVRGRQNHRDSWRTAMNAAMPGRPGRVSPRPASRCPGLHITERDGPTGDRPALLNCRAANRTLGPRNCRDRPLIHELPARSLQPAGGCALRHPGGFREGNQSQAWRQLDHLLRRGPIPLREEYRAWGKNWRILGYPTVREVASSPLRLEAYRFRRQLYYAICAILVSTPSSYSEGVRYPSPFCIL